MDYVSLIRGESSAEPEIFPLILASTLLVASLGFSLHVAMSMLCKNRVRKHNSDDDDDDDGDLEKHDNDNDSVGHNSWVAAANGFDPAKDDDDEQLDTESSDDPDQAASGTTSETWSGEIHHHHVTDDDDEQQVDGDNMMVAWAQIGSCQYPSNAPVVTEFPQNNANGKVVETSAAKEAAHVVGTAPIQHVATYRNPPKQTEEEVQLPNNNISHGTRRLDAPKTKDCAKEAATPSPTSVRDLYHYNEFQEQQEVHVPMAHVATEQVNVSDLLDLADTKLAELSGDDSMLVVQASRSSSRQQRELSNVSSEQQVVITEYKAESFDDDLESLLNTSCGVSRETHGKRDPPGMVCSPARAGLRKRAVGQQNSEPSRDVRADDLSVANHFRQRSAAKSPSLQKDNHGRSRDPPTFAPDPIADVSGILQTSVVARKKSVERNLIAEQPVDLEALEGGKPVLEPSDEPIQHSDLHCLSSINEDSSVAVPLGYDSSDTHAPLPRDGEDNAVCTVSISPENSKHVQTSRKSCKGSERTSSTRTLSYARRTSSRHSSYLSKSAALVSWNRLSCSYPPKKGSLNPIVSLNSVSGEMRSGELVAIMGGSGSGKSTLLDILSGRKSLGKIEGEMSILGERVTDVKLGESLLKDVAAYIPQSEQFFPTQTPEEAVAFAADLKLGPDKRGNDVRQSRIDSLLDQIGLRKEARKRAIGGTLAGGLVIRGLSGGERKRLALACALAMKPSVLFLDEITSGLDSENAVIVIELLKKMCVSLNVAAAVVIHQPSTEIFECFDRLILLASGHCVFSDRCSNIPRFYEDVLKAPMPVKYLLPTDLMKRALNIDYSEFGDDNLSELVPTRSLDAKRVGSKPSTFYKFRTVFRRNLVNHYIRNLTNLAARLVIYGNIAAILGVVFWQVGAGGDGPLSETDATILLGAFLFLVTISYLVPFAQISTFFFDKHVFTAESALGLYPPWMYSVSQSILEVWVQVLAASIQAFIAVPMIGLWNPGMSKIASFLTMLSVFCVNGVVGNAIVLFVSMITFSSDVAFLVGAAIVVVGMATSGGFVPFPVMAEFSVWMQWLSPMKYSLQSFAIGAFEGTGAYFLVAIRELDSPETVTTNLGVLFLFLAALAAGTVASLSRQREVK